MSGLDHAIAQLDERLRLYPAARYPVQHATAQFHLGVALANRGRAEEAERALKAAVEIFGRAGLEVEHAKATNALGAALRLRGELEAAAMAFESAAAAFAAAGLRLEQGAALFNLGLVRREAGAPEQALEPLARARALLDGRAAAAATRERGAALLELGELHEAARALEQALELADRSADPQERGAAANTLGLVHLAAGRAEEAAASFEAAVGSHPRSLRPEAFAMAKANLALARDAAGDAARARLAARQALALPEVAEPVRQQAAAVLARLGAPTDDLLAVLANEPPERLPALVREELVRTLDEPPAARLADAATWIDAQLGCDDPDGLAEAWLGGLLEVPPTAMETLVRATLEALRERDPEARADFRGQVERAAARFHVPQTERLERTFASIASQLGGEMWS